MNYTIYQIDSFTREKFKGNPAGVVLNADGLTEQQMQQIARELNNSETAFLFSPDNDECDAVIRYFTPLTEVPTCGHATIAAFYAKATEERLESCILKVRTKIGILQIEVIKGEGDYQIVMTQGKLELQPPLEEKIVKKIIAALGLEETDLDKRCPIQIASTGHSKVMIGINEKKKLNSLEPDFNELKSISKEIKCNGYFVFTFDSKEKDVLTCGRMFAPAVGINEDPVTGNANGPLGGYLIENNLAGTINDCFEFKGLQGEQIGREGIIHVKVMVKDSRPTQIQIRGDAVIVFKTEMEV